MRKIENTEMEAVGFEAASRFLRRRGMEIIATPFECEAGEIAFVAKDEERGGLVFVEFSMSMGPAGGFPPVKVDAGRRDRLERIALAFLANYDETDISIHFDHLHAAALSDSVAMVRYHRNILG